MNSGGELNGIGLTPPRSPGVNWVLWLEDAVKGPGVRIDLDVRRIWKCPRCGRVARTAGHAVSQRCGCADDGVWMQLQPPVKRAAFSPPPRVSLPEENPEEPAAEQTPAPIELSAEAVIIDAIVVETETPEAPPEQSPSEEPSPPAEEDAFGAGIIPPPEPSP
jgi:hypothetical protein